MSPRSILLRGATVLIHDQDDHVHAVGADLLIEGNLIAKIEAGIEVGPGVEIIDCVDKILSPGFIDTHHHVWQTLLKGRHANQLLVDYMPPGKSPSVNLGCGVTDKARKFHFFAPQSLRYLLGSVGRLP